MSAQAAAKAAAQTAKAAAQSERGFLNRGAKRDPELYVCSFPAHHLASPEESPSPLRRDLFSHPDLCADSHGRNVGGLWSGWVLFR
jgi:hypothetical protein